MSSSRLPGKVMLDIAGKPVLWHIIHRLKKSRHLTDIVIATTTDSGDDQLAEYAASQGVEVVRGSRDNVLERFNIAVKRFDPDYIVRVLSDCPTLDTATMDNFIDILIAEDGDRCAWDPALDNIHGGFEPFSRNLFNMILAEASNHPVAKEHVFAYVGINPFLGKVVCMEPPQEHLLEKPRLWLDTPADLQLLRELYARTGSEAGEIDAADIARLLNTDHELYAINAHVLQKSIDAQYFKAVMCCYGGPEIGMGHLSRMVAVASALRDEFATAVIFAVNNDPKVLEVLQRHQFPYLPRQDDQSEGEWLDHAIEGYEANAIVLDVRSDLPPDALDRWRQQNIVCALIDDISPRLNHADVVYFPPGKRTQELPQHVGNADVKVGWDWLALSSKYAIKPERKEKDHPTILVTNGASDPSAHSALIMEALSEIPEALSVELVIGPLNQNRQHLIELAEQSHHCVTVHEAVSNMEELMARSDVGILTFGVSASEAAAMGLASIYLCLDEDQNQSASIFERDGFGVNLGVFGTDDSGELITAVRELLENSSLRTRMSHTAMQAVDGKGAQRIAMDIMNRIKANLAENTAGGNS